MKKERCFIDGFLPAGFVAFMIPLLALLSSGCRHVEGKYSSLNAAAINNAVTETAAPTNTVRVSRKLEPAWLKPSPDLFTLGPGDRLEIEVLGDPASRAITVVAPDGKLYFNFLEGIDVWGATMAQAKALLEKEFANYLRER